MKKQLCILTVVFMVVAFCACGETEPEPVSYTTGEMTFSLNGSLVQETDDQQAIEKMAEAAGYDSGNQLETQLRERDAEYLYFRGDDFDLLVESIPTTYDNDAIDRCIEATVQESEGKDALEEIKAGDAAGRIGFLSSDASEICGLYLLKDGVFYLFESYIHGDADKARRILEEVAGTVHFKSGAMGTKTVTCGDLKYEIPAKYRALDFDEADAFYDEQWYGTAGDSYLEFGSFYFIDWEPGYDLDTAVSSLTDELQSAKHTSADSELGSVEYITGTDESGYHHIMALFRYNEKCYCFNMFSEEEMTKEDIQPILDSIQVEEKKTEQDDTSAE